MTEEMRICIDRILPWEMVVPAAETSLRENPRNAPIVRSRPGMGVVPRSPMEMALLTGRKWENGRTLRVRFLDGDSRVRSKVESYAHQWSDHANLKIEFGSDSDAEIRVAFQMGQGSWSWVGTEARVIPADEPTMNFGWLTPTTPDQEYSRVVIHEFGHALGCIHEHQSPAAAIPWDREAVYRIYSGPPNNWTREEIDHNLFARYSRTITQFSDFDPASIMLYAIPDELTIGDFEIGWNTQLSQTDSKFVGAMYPFDPKGVTEVTVDGSPAEASIGTHGEEDVFRFAVAAEGPYTIETEGPTDVVVGLFGPDDETHLVAEDDDSGKAMNARIAEALGPGTYHVRVRHYRPTGTGTYRLSVSAE